MPGYKRKPYAATRRAPAKRRAPARYAAPRRALSTSTNTRDMCTEICSSYFEVWGQQSPTGQAGTMAYSLKVDPINCKLVLGSSQNMTDPQNPVNHLSVTAHDGADAAITSDTTNIAFSRLNVLKDLYRQMRVNSISIRVTADRGCGLDNPMIALTDKGDKACVVQVGAAMGQAHRSKVLTESDRTLSYGWKPRVSADYDWHMISDELGQSDSTYLKVLQELEKKVEAGGATCKHRVEITISVSLKDSKN